MFIVLPRRPRRPQKTPKAPKGPQKVPKGPPKAPRVQCMNSRSYFCSAKPKLLFYFYIKVFRKEKNKYQVSRLKKRSKKFRETENEFIKKWLQPNFILFTSTSKWHNFKKLMIIFLDQSESFWLFERKKSFSQKSFFLCFSSFFVSWEKKQNREKSLKARKSGSFESNFLTEKMSNLCFSEKSFESVIFSLMLE